MGKISNHEKGKNYEKLCVAILNRLSGGLDLEHIKPQQKIVGAAGAYITFDGVSKQSSDGQLVILEFRCTIERQKQSAIATIESYIRDVGAAKGIIVTNQELQSGAKKYASHHGISHYQLPESCTESNFFMKCDDKHFVGIPSIGECSNFGKAHIGQ